MILILINIEYVSSMECSTNSKSEQTAIGYNMDESHKRKIEQEKQLKNVWGL